MAETTRERILEGALELIGGAPSGELDMQHLADWIGVSRKTIYNHFPGKNELISEAVAAGIDRIVCSLNGIAEDPSLSFVERLDRVIEEGFRESGRLLGSGSPLGVVNRAVSELGRHIRDLVRRIAAEAAREGLLAREVDPEVFSQVILALVGGVHALEEPELLPCTPLQLLRESFRICLVGALSPKGEETLKGIGILAGPGVSL